MNDQLPLLEPCLICLRLTASRAARRVDIDPWGIGSHRHCWTAAERWYPEAFGVTTTEEAKGGDAADVVPLFRKAAL